MFFMSSVKGTLEYRKQVLYGVVDAAVRDQQTHKFS